MREALSSRLVEAEEAAADAVQNVTEAQEEMRRQSESAKAAAAAAAAAEAALRSELAAAV